MLEAEIVFTPNVPFEPLSVKVKSVFGVELLSLMVSVPFALDAPSVMTGLVFENISGAALDKVSPAKVGAAVESIFCGNDKVIAPVLPETLT